MSTLRIDATDAGAARKALAVALGHAPDDWADTEELLDEADQQGVTVVLRIADEA